MDINLAFTITLCIASLFGILSVLLLIAVPLLYLDDTIINKLFGLEWCMRKYAKTKKMHLDTQRSKIIMELIIGFEIYFFVCFSCCYLLSKLAHYFN